jgi:HEAT repeat protein
MALEFDFNTLIEFLSSPAWEQRRNAAEDLGAYGAPEAIPYLMRALSDQVGAVQYAAAVALGKIGTEGVVPALLACLDNPKFRFPAPVIEALGNLRIRDAVPYFIRFLRHPDQHVRGIANTSLMVTTGKAMGFRATADEQHREAVVQKWERWWAQNAKSFQPPGRGAARRR